MPFNGAFRLRATSLLSDDDVVHTENGHCRVDSELDSPSLGVVVIKDTRTFSLKRLNRFVTQVDARGLLTIRMRSIEGRHHLSLVKASVLGEDLWDNFESLGELENTVLLKAR